MPALESDEGAVCAACARPFCELSSPVFSSTGFSSTGFSSPGFLDFGSALGLFFRKDLRKNLSVCCTDGDEKSLSRTLVSITLVSDELVSITLSGE